MTRPVATVQDLEGAQAAPADHGLFGPGSATWQLMGEPVLWVAGIRALYLQALHPRTMLGTWQNSALVHRHFNPPLPPALVPLRLVVPALNTLAFAALPRWARKLYGAPGNPATDTVTTATLTALYQATRLTPAQLRYTRTVRQAKQASALTSSRSASSHHNANHQNQVTAAHLDGH